MSWVLSQESLLGRKEDGHALEETQGVRKKRKQVIDTSNLVQCLRIRLALMEQAWSWPRAQEVAMVVVKSEGCTERRSEEDARVEDGELQKREIE